MGLNGLIFKRVNENENIRWTTCQNFAKGDIFSWNREIVEKFKESVDLKYLHRYQYQLLNYLFSIAK